MSSIQNSILNSEIDSCESAPSNRQKVIILGSGPNRIGQGIEFDYTCVHASFAFKEHGIEAIMVNCNPETVSTDYDTSDRLYFEPLTAEDTIELIKKEMSNGKLLGVNVQFGGQTPLSLAKFLQDENIPIIGTSPDMIDLAEDRDRFKQLLQKLKLNQPLNFIAYSKQQVIEQVKEIGFPVVVRPSYVLGGKGMAIIYDENYLLKYLAEYSEVFDTGPLLLDKFLTDAIEVDVDALCDGHEVFVAGIMQHIEEAGIHSGDSACSIPPYSISEKSINEIKKATQKLALALNVKGLMNVQYALKDDILYVLEVNPRASRTVPFVAKATGIPIAKIASLIMVGKKLSDFKLTEKKLDYYAVKEVVLPFARFSNVDIILGPEMKSTGEVMGIDKSFSLAFAKAQIATGTKLPTSGLVFLSVKDSDKKYLPEIAQKLIDIGFRIVATRGTAKYLAENNIAVTIVNKITEDKPHVVDMIDRKEITLVINTTEGAQATKDSFSIRRTSLMRGVTYTTTISGAKALVGAIEAYKNNNCKFEVFALQELSSSSNYN
ncbi:MAG: carbamoyl-phosphate synthase large subunit [Proteobacteria bacterium]|nr:carbamoyl-phosphate synthase large subunit [Pseudomonadota bacterium]NCA27875.1 carbamoyl-phosphate synthase large subunit [Pseudomonadota bacterium]